uniref:Uncharacterized protein n=1 Tax=Timema douglasi TaxID=61478 RepID=A0A7R8VFJ3_TIMDO|nr:unnamed protein product [Timema douglasi]
MNQLPMCLLLLLVTVLVPSSQKSTDCAPKPPVDSQPGPPPGPIPGPPPRSSACISPNMTTNRTGRSPGHQTNMMTNRTGRSPGTQTDMMTNRTGRSPGTQTNMTTNSTGRSPGTQTNMTTNNTGRSPGTQTNMTTESPGPRYTAGYPFRCRPSPCPVLYDLIYFHNTSLATNSTITSPLVL